jgi:3-deoxy-D-arabino-heptulosonate 7-phosphate (DAHP) synthase
MARAAMATGVDGVMVEVHPEPSKALSDGPQALTFPMFERLMVDLRGIALAMNLSLAG